MDGLSAAASGFTVASIALQLAESLHKTCEFWSSIQEAPDDIRAMSLEVDLLSGIFSRIANESQHTQPDALLVAALSVCTSKVKALTAILNAIEPGFSARKTYTRKWAAVKAVRKSGKIAKFQEELGRLKSDLMLVQLNQNSRFDRQRQFVLEQSLDRINEGVNSLSLQRRTAMVQTDAMMSGVPMLTFPGPQSTESHEANSDIIPYDQSHSASLEPRKILRRKAKRAVVSRERSFFDCVFGTVQTDLTRMSCGVEDSSDMAYDQGTDTYQEDASYLIRPATWLLRLGFCYGFCLRLSVSPAYGWKLNLNPFRPVPDDALVWELCRKGDVIGVRELISRGQASLKDTNSWGDTLLHVAASWMQPGLCQYLINVGIDPTVHNNMGSTPIEVGSSWTKLVSKEFQDMIRIFLNSLDFSDFAKDDDYAGGFVNFLREAYSWGQEGSLVSATSQALHLNLTLQHFSFEIQTYLEEAHYADLLHHLFVHDYYRQEIELLSKLAGKNIINATPIFYGYSILHTLFTRDNVLPKLIFVLERGANIHQRGVNNTTKRIEESPISLAMYNSWTFLTWIKGLRAVGVNLEAVANEEIERNAALHPGWKKKVLLDLFEGEHKDYYDRPCFFKYLCSDCGFARSPDKIHIEPHWRHYLKKRIQGTNYNESHYGPEEMRLNDAIQNEFAPTADSMLGTDKNKGDVRHIMTEDEDYRYGWCGLRTDVDPHTYPKLESLEAECPYNKGEEICMDCWLDFVQTGDRTEIQNRWNRCYNDPIPEAKIVTEDEGAEDEESEDEFSPFHIHT